MDDILRYVGGPIGAASLATIAGASALYWATSRSAGTVIELPFPLDCQTMPLSSFDDVRVSRLCKDGKYVAYIYDDCRTLNDVLRRGAKFNSGQNNCLGYRDGGIDKPYAWFNYEQTLKRMTNIGSGLLAKGLEPRPTTFVGVYAQNSPEWVLTEHACYTYSMVIVPLYDTLGPEACAYIINQADITLVVCDTDDKIALLLEHAASTPSLRHVVHIQPVSPETIARATQHNIELVSLADLERLGQAQPKEHVPPKPTDLATICYTSGTTGNPKGVMLSHGNVIACAAAVSLQLGNYRATTADVMISFLPLAHMLERICETIVYMDGGSVAFFSGNIRNLMDDLKAVRPTVMPAVPRLLNRIYDKVLGSTEHSFIKRNMLRMALKAKEADLVKSIVRNNTLWDRLVFSRVQEGVGGRVRLLVVGSAPLAANVLTFMRCALGCIVIEGYGQTECVAPATLTAQGDSEPGHVGPPIPCCGIKLVDVPEMEYFGSEGKGEVCIQGNNVFQGYFRDDEKTKETLDVDGWLHTGDIGMWLPNGTLKIVDRKKHIFKLAQGEYIAPEKIENIYIRSTLITQIFVHGESLKSCLVAIVVPDPDTLKKWASEHGMDVNNTSYNQMCANPALKKSIMEDLTSLGKKAGLKSFEQVKDICITTEAFTVENNLLTPTLKTKRPELKKFFTPQIEAMYRVLA